VVLGVSAMDGIAHNEIEHREIVPLLVVLAVAFFVAYRSDKMHAHIDGLEKRLTKLTEKTNS
jgi:ketopantoate reductase